MKGKKRKTVRVGHETPATDAPADQGALGVAVVVTVDAATLAEWPKCRRVNCKRPIDPRFAQQFEYVCTGCAIQENADKCRDYYEEKKRLAYARLVASGLVAVKINHHTQPEEIECVSVNE
jgi:hypothetical protein